MRDRRNVAARNKLVVSSRVKIVRAQTYPHCLRGPRSEEVELESAVSCESRKKQRRPNGDTHRSHLRVSSWLYPSLLTIWH